MAFQHIVIDTNVTLDGVRDEHSAAWRIIQDVLDGRLTAHLSHPLEREIRLILSRKLDDQEYAQRIERFLATARRVELRPHGSLVPDDPEDDKVLATAIDAHADAVISSDKHLLTLDPYGSIRILTPVQFRNAQQADSPSAWADFLKQIGLTP